MVFPIARLVVVFQREVVSLVLLLRVILRFCSSFWKSHLLDGTILCCFFLPCSCSESHVSTSGWRSQMTHKVSPEARASLPWILARACWTACHGTKFSCKFHKKKNWAFEQPERGINHDRFFMFQWPQLNEPSGSQLPTFNSNTHLYKHPEHPSWGCPSKREKSNASSKFPLNKNCTFGDIITPFAGNPGNPHVNDVLSGKTHWPGLIYHLSSFPACLFNGSLPLRSPTN